MLTFPGIRILAALATAFVLVVAFLAWQHFFPVTSAAGWHHEVMMEDVTLVSALAKGGDGALYITRELNKQRGSLFKRLPDGSVQEILGRLDKPDGLALFKGGIAISQEGSECPVLWMHQGLVTPLFQGRNIEGLATDARVLYAIEDRVMDGRLWQYDPATSETKVLRDHLQEGEGVAVCPDGRVFYTEKRRGWIKQLRHDADIDPVVHQNLKAPGFLMCNEDGLWISEDATHGARLLLFDAAGNEHVILWHLRSAQTVIAERPGHLLLAEQGRNRILAITRQPNH